MDFKSLLSQLDQLNEAKEKTKTGLKHTAEPGGYGRKDDEDDEGNKVKSTAAKKGKGRPKKDADDSGETKKYDFSAFGVKSGKDVKLPKHDKKKTTVVKGKAQSHADNKKDDGTDPGEEPKTKDKKKSLKEYFDLLDKALNESGYTTAPMPGAVQVKDATGKVVATAKNPQAAEMFKKGDVTLGNPEEMHEGDGEGIGALPKQTSPEQPYQVPFGTDTNLVFARGKRSGLHYAMMRGMLSDPWYFKFNGKVYSISDNGDGIPKPIEQGMAEADQPPNDSLMSPIGEAKKAKKPDANKKDLPGNQDKLDVAEPKGKLDAKDFKELSKKKKVKEGMEHKLKAARHIGKAHALSKQGYNCNYDDMEESRHYHEGFKEGLDECYGQIPIQGYVGETSNEVADMASYGAHTPTMEDDVMEVGRGEYMKQKAKSTPGGTFNAFGQTMHDKDVLESPFFEAWDKELNAILEGKEVTEGVTISSSTGQQGSPNSVSINATDADADSVLNMIKQLGLGGLGGQEQAAPASQAMSLAPADDGEMPAEIEVVDDHDDMLSLIRKMSGQGPAQATAQPTGDYEEEGGEPAHSHEEGPEGGAEDGAEDGVKEETCESCGSAMQEGHSCGEAVEENETIPQEEDEVAEDAAQNDGQAETTADENAEAEEDEALATVDAAQNESDEELEESLANGNDDTFEADMDFMTKVITGGANGQKRNQSVGGPMTIASTPMKESTDLLTDWRKLSGIN